ncbi:MAG: hypothetical protein D4R38_02640 [Dehalococcoidia bacterium]|nr:MAG: hypothetical protein D4R38_02640 [Dehalococcoidia bacterium]
MKKIELTLLIMVFKACAEAVLAMVKANQEEIEIPTRTTDFLYDLLSEHPELEVSNFFRHELEELP